MDEVEKLVGGKKAGEMKEKSITIYNYAQEYAAKRGIIIADTKMEFGLEGDRLILIDELLTPDSSRIWDSKLYQAGQAQPSYDKQPLRDWLVETGWNKEPPAPPLPSNVVEATSRQYIQAYERITGRVFK
jgi:phosphoribosylaminoimidazole-succinocarboxamide synthase